ncbi:MAG TPA: hypothetical protein VFE79_11705 [Paraburkholderia sp.]|nr:hypothetical protein [Paraburkholderia sp.]
MWVRAVAAAVAVWCVSGVAVAAGYAEVWNPPEAAGHGAQHVKKTAGKPVDGSHAGAGVKHGAKAGSKHAGAQVASASKSGNKAAAHGNVNKVTTGKGPDKSAAPSAVKPKPKAKKPAVMVQTKKPRGQMAQTEAKAPGSKRVPVSVAREQTARPEAVTMAAATGPSVSHTTMAASPMGTSVGASGSNNMGNPATASSGSLPPILH